MCLGDSFKTFANDPWLRKTLDDTLLQGRCDEVFPDWIRGCIDRKDHARCHISGHFVWWRMRADEVSAVELLQNLEIIGVRLFVGRCVEDADKGVPLSLDRLNDFVGEVGVLERHICWDRFKYELQLGLC